MSKILNSLLFLAAILAIGLILSGHKENFELMPAKIIYDLDLFESLSYEQKVFGYGASTKGNVLLQFCGFTEKEIPYIAEVNEEKFGAYTPGSLIPIISEEEAKAMKPDYFLVLPWHFKDNILRREKEYISNGGKFIFPLPEIEIV